MCEHDEIDDLNYSDIQKDLDFDNMKEGGFNAIRLAHYPQDRYFIDKCND